MICTTPILLHTCPPPVYNPRTCLSRPCAQPAGLLSTLRYKWPSDAAAGGAAESGTAGLSSWPAANWAGPGSEFGRLVYSTYSEEDFKDMLTQHYSNIQPPAYTDFGKPNCSSANPRKADLNVSGTVGGCPVEQARQGRPREGEEAGGAWEWQTHAEGRGA